MKRGLLFVLGILMLSGFVFAETNLGSGSSQVTFSGGVGCFSNVTSAYWIIGSNETVFNSSGNVGNCSRYYNVSIASSRTCCPTSYQCGLSSGVCSITTQTGCDQYNTSSDCVSDSNRVATASARALTGINNICDPTNQTNYMDSFGRPCINYSACSCYWNSSSSKCGPAVTSSSDCQGVPSINQTCNWIEYGTQNMCESQGKIVVTYTASGNALGTVMSNGVNCSNIQVDYPCSASLKLPFFDGFNFIIAILVIATVYFVSSRKI